MAELVNEMRDSYTIIDNEVFNYNLSSMAFKIYISLYANDTYVLEETEEGLNDFIDYLSDKILKKDIELFNIDRSLIYNCLFEITEHDLLDKNVSKFIRKNRIGETKNVYNKTKAKRELFNSF